MGTDVTCAFHSKAWDGGIHCRRVRHSLPLSVKVWRSLDACQNVSRGRRPIGLQKKNGQRAGAGRNEYAVMEGLNGEPAVGIEPTTARLRIGCSTTELRWRVLRSTRSCPGADSNRDALRHHPLKMACLPISPPGQTNLLARPAAFATSYQISAFRNPEYENSSPSSRPKSRQL